MIELQVPNVGFLSSCSSHRNLVAGMRAECESGAQDGVLEGSEEASAEVLAR